MCPKVSKNKTKVVNDKKSQQKNKNDENDETKPLVRKKKKGEIKHEKKLMKKKAKAIEKFGDAEGKSASNSQSDDDDNNGNDLDLSKNSAFVQSIIEKKLKIEVNKEDDTKNNKISFTREDVRNDFLDGFINIKKGKAAKPEINKTSEGYGAEAYKLILYGKKEKATEYLDRAIALDPFDIRHYINRSYTHMCTGDYQEAMNDTQVVIAQNTHISDLARMKCRQGQIYALMQRYNKAEECFKDCLNLFPDSATVQCEFMRMKVNQLVKLGFSETNIIAVLYDWPQIALKEAKMLLEELSESQTGIADPSFYESEDEVYQSDTEEDRSDTTLFMEMIDFNPRREDDLWKREIVQQNSQELDRATPANPQLSANSAQKTSDLKVIHATAPKKLKIPQGVNINNRAVWIGSLTHKMTESMLKRAFLQFGPIHSIYRTPGSACAFVNFEHEESAIRALAAESVEVDGKMLPVRLNKRNR